MSRQTMWACVAIVAVAVGVALMLGSAGFLLFAVPCMLMMGGSARGSSRGK